MNYISREERETSQSLLEDRLATRYPAKAAWTINRNIFHRCGTRRIVVCVLLPRTPPGLFPLLLAASPRLSLPACPVFIPFIRSARFLGYFHNDTLCNVNYCRRNELEEVFQDAASRHPHPLSLSLSPSSSSRFLVLAVSRSLAAIHSAVFLLSTS